MGTAESLVVSGVAQQLLGTMVAALKYQSPTELGRPRGPRGVQSVRRSKPDEVGGTML